MRRLAVAFAVMQPAGAFTLLGAVYWLVFAESVRLALVALRDPEPMSPIARRAEDLPATAWRRPLPSGTTLTMEGAPWA